MHLRRSTILLGAATLALGGFTAAAQPAQAAGPADVTCSGGPIASGTYRSIAVTGECSVPAGADITVLRNVTVAAGAVFDAQAAPSTIDIHGNATAGEGSYFGLGCTPAHGCEGGDTFSDVHVGGNITLDRVFDAALNGIEVDGNVTSEGGGGGLIFPNGFIPFSVKDDTIHGNLVVRDLTTTWFGVIRTTVDRNVSLSNITVDDPDGNEIVADHVGRNLICNGMSPAPQFGDAVEGAPDDYGPSVVGGKALGQCAFAVQPR